LSNIHDILQQYWKYKSFRPLQEEIILSVLEGKDALALLPTGGGKSICFQVPALAMDGICIVVSPLIALMKDQVFQLQRRGIPSILIYSGMNKKEIDIALDNCVYGNIKFLYVSPERLQTDIMIERAKKMKVNLLAVDEAHCISQWGYDFRPSYLKIAEFRSVLGNVPVLALTATATKEVRKDIVEKLELKDPKLFQKSFARDNLSYSCLYEEDKEKKLISILQKVQGSSVVYVRSRKMAKELALFLVRHQISATYYHAGLSNDQRSEIQTAWINNKVRVIVATNAFGMGIDKPDVRLVVHIGLPDSLEAYYQEAGRAGRDERKAFAVALYDLKDTADMQKRLEISYPSVDYIKRVYQSLANYYKIAVGSSMFSTYDFAIDDFVNTFRFNLQEAYYALKRLEEEGLIHLNESFFNPAKVLIRVDNTTLYQFQVANAKFDILIKALLRIYGGELFSNFQAISARQIGSLLNISDKEVEEKLIALDKMEILIFERQRDKPQITFTTARYDAGNLPFDGKSYNKRKEKDQKKINAVVSYAKNQLRCRTQLLLAYFDEYKEEDCGVCDNCIQKKKAAAREDFDKRILDAIMSSIGEGQVGVEELLQMMDSFKKDDILEALRKMIDGKLLTFDKEGENIKKI
jgi:ATP-dependent DNA helicase RecQ